MTTETPASRFGDSTLIESMRRISGLLQSGQYSEAHSLLETLVAANPDYVEGLRLLAGTKQTLGDLSQVEVLLRRALEFDPDWTPTLSSLAEFLLTSGRNDEAAQLLQRAIQGTPAYPRAAFLLVRLYLDTGRPAAALEIATLWCSGSKLDGDLTALHVAAYAALGRANEAVAHYRQILVRDPQNLIAGLQCPRFRRDESQDDGSFAWDIPQGRKVASVRSVVLQEEPVAFEHVEELLRDRVVAAL